MTVDETLKLIQDCREKNIRINIKYANLEGASLTEGMFINANLEGANLGYASLLNANLKFANLKYTNLIGASLRHSNFEGANLWNVKIEASQKDDILSALGVLIKDKERRAERQE